MSHNYKKNELTTGFTLKGGVTNEKILTIDENLSSDNLITSIHSKQLSQGITSERYSASSGTGIYVPDDVNVDLGSRDYTLVWKGSIPDIDSTNDKVLILKHTPTTYADYWYLSICQAPGVNLGKLMTYFNGSTVAVTCYSDDVVPFQDNTIHEIGVVVVREISGVFDGSITFYIDGIQFGSSTAINKSIAGAGESLDNTGDLNTLGSMASQCQGTVLHTYIFNRALTSDEMLSLYHNGIDNADKWGSQTAKYTSDFSAGVDGWGATSNVTIDGNIDGIGGEDNWLRITGSAALGTHYTQKNGTFVINKRYRVTGTYYFPSGLPNADGIGICFGSLNAPYVSVITPIFDTVTNFCVENIAFNINYQITMLKNGAISFTTTTSDIIYIKNLVYTEIGATLALEPEGIQHDKWYDSSSNGLKATYPAAGWAMLKTPIRHNKQQITPANYDADQTLTIAELLNGIITRTTSSGANITFTLPTGSLTELASNFSIGSYFDWSIINKSTTSAGDTVTVAAAASGHTVVGNMVVQSQHSSTGQIYGSSGRFRTVKTALNTFVTYRMA